jgi:hypothetical protein
LPRVAEYIAATQPAGMAPSALADSAYIQRMADFWRRTKLPQT